MHIAQTAHTTHASLTQYTTCTLHTAHTTHASLINHRLPCYRVLQRIWDWSPGFANPCVAGLSRQLELGRNRVAAAARPQQVRCLAARKLRTCSAAVRAA